jgi:Topoisomerase IA
MSRSWSLIRVQTASIWQVIWKKQRNKWSVRSMRNINCWDRLTSPKHRM